MFINQNFNKICSPFNTCGSVTLSFHLEEDFNLRLVMLIKLCFTLTVELFSIELNKGFCVSSVYGACDRDQRDAFFKELWDVCHSLASSWLLGVTLTLPKMLKTKETIPNV